MPLTINWTTAAKASVDAATQTKIEDAVRTAASSSYNDKGVFTNALIRSNVHATTGADHHKDPKGNHITSDYWNARDAYTAHVYVLRPASGAYTVTGMTFSSRRNPPSLAATVEKVDYEEF
ncbi:hypothetical protein H0H93_015605 [Arthromyces matolae]|nr:hypothetical protein H0H93_015605 [Arthromyces matolae]